VVFIFNFYLRVNELNSYKIETQAMKNLFLFFLVTINTISYSQSIFEGDVVLLTQEDVDDFTANSYEQIVGDLTIGGDNSDISSLIGLTTLNSINGNLRLSGCPILISLEGLNNLQTLNSDFIFGLDNVENFIGLDSLTSIGGTFLSESLSLKSFQGLESLANVSGTLALLASPNVVDFSGLNSLLTLGGLYVFNNQSFGNNPVGLESLNGLDSLMSVGFISCQYNNFLFDYCGVYNVIVNGGLEGDFNLSFNGYNPSINQMTNGYCLETNGDPYITHPYENSYHVGNVTIKVLGLNNFSNGTIFNLFYSLDDGVSWTFSESMLYDSESNSFPIWNIEGLVTEPKTIKIQLVNESNTFVLTSSPFIIQPIDFFIDYGFSNTSISTIVFPSEGSFATYQGWSILDNDFGGIYASTAHLCVDENALDAAWISDGTPPDTFAESCGRDVRAPFDGKILKVVSDYTSTIDDCGGNQDGKYGRQLVIQSLKDKTIALRFAHLYEIKDSLEVNQFVQEGQLLGKIGGSGTEFAHLHASLYKNIYDYIAFNGRGTSFIENLSNLDEVILTGITDQTICDTVSEKFSADFLFSNNSVIASESQIIESNSELNSFSENQYTYVGGDLIIRSNPELSNRYTSDSITSLTEIESVLAIEGDLIIQDVDITSLDGLNHITYVGGNLIIKENSLLNNYCALYSLIQNEGVQGNVLITNNMINLDLESILSSCSNTLSTQIGSKFSRHIIVYPNPFNEELRFNFDDNRLNVMQVTLFNLEGKKLAIKLKNNKVDTSKLPSGVYILGLETDTGSVKFKVIKSD